MAQLFYPFLKDRLLMGLGCCPSGLQLCLGNFILA